MYISFVAYLVIQKLQVASSENVTFLVEHLLVSKLLLDSKKMILFSKGICFPPRVLAMAVISVTLALLIMYIVRFVHVPIFPFRKKGRMSPHPYPPAPNVPLGHVDSFELKAGFIEKRPITEITFFLPVLLRCN